MSVNAKHVRGRFETDKFERIRALVETSDAHSARLLPWAVSDLVSGSLDNQSPSQYVVECLPALFQAMTRMLRAAGTYRQAPAPQTFAAAKRELLMALEAFTDEVQLNHQPQLSQLAG